MLVLILILSWKPTHAYTYSYFDCSQPAHLETFDRLALCQQTPAKTVPDQNPMETWMLLQQATSHEVNGTSCEEEDQSSKDTVEYGATPSWEEHPLSLPL